MSADDQVIVNVGELRFTWREWDPRALGADIEWTHPGLAVRADQSVVVFDQSSQELVHLDRKGGEIGRVSVPAACAHGLTATSADRTWIADTGVRVKVVEGEVITEQRPGSVFQVDSEGRPTMTLPRPPVRAYDGGPYVPTSVAVAEESSGGSGDIWVADGYGQSLVHRFSPSGEWLSVIDGEEGAGRFARSHAVFVDGRGSEPRVLVSDRSNHRVGVYDLDGAFVMAFGAGELRMPSAFATTGDLLVIAELWSRMALYDREYRLVGYLGAGEEAWEEDAWPNRRDGGRVARRPVTPGRFNAPHGLGAADGTLYVAEWSLGGRIVELSPTLTA